MVRTSAELVIQAKKDFTPNGQHLVAADPYVYWSTVTYPYLLQLYAGAHNRLLLDVLDGVWDFDSVWAWEVRGCIPAGELAALRLERVMDRLEMLVNTVTHTLNRGGA